MNALSMNLNTLLANSNLDASFLALKNYQLIWDFDNVFASTERWSHYAAYDLLAPLNFPMVPRHVLSNYLYGHKVNTHEELITKLFKEKNLGDVVFPENFYKERDELQNQMFADIRFIENMENLLFNFAEMGIKMSVASRSRAEPFFAKAKGLQLEMFIPEHKWFLDCQIGDNSSNLMNAYQTCKNRGLSHDEFHYDKVKVFAYAAVSQKAMFKKCIVVEDSVNGIKSALKLGMNAFAFLGAEDINAVETRKKLKGLLPDSHIAETAEDLALKMLTFAKKQTA